MKILPTTKADKIRLAVLAILLLGVVLFFRLDRLAVYHFSAKQEGDMIFQSLPHGDLVDTIEAVTNSPWSHCGLLVWRDGQWQVAEAIGQVRYTPLYSWLVRGRRAAFATYRVRDLPVERTRAIIPGVEKLLGRPYDFSYAPDDTDIYCSELIYKVYDRELGIKIGTWQKLGDLNWKDREASIKDLKGGPVPLTREMITPVALTRSPNVVQVAP